MDIHLKAKMEERRTRILRRLQDDLEMLNNAHIALHRPTPLLGVVDDHISRVMQSLFKEIDQLKREIDPNV